MVVESDQAGLALAGEMTRETWRALAPGFAIAGAVETRVSAERPPAVLGGEAPAGHAVEAG